MYINDAATSEIHTTYKSPLRRQNVQFINVKPDGTYRNP
jgi:hypothetical protein